MTEPNKEGEPKRSDYGIGVFEDAHFRRDHEEYKKKKLKDTVSPKPDIFEVCVKRAWEEHVVPLQSRIAELESRLRAVLSRPNFKGISTRLALRSLILPRF